MPVNHYFQSGNGIGNDAEKRLHEDLIIEGLKIYGQSENKTAVISFNIKSIHPYDLGTILDKLGIAVRTGHHCAQPAMRHFNVDTTLRVSFGVYNNEEDIDNFLINLKDIVKYLQ